MSQNRIPIACYAVLAPLLSSFTMLAVSQDCSTCTNPYLIDNRNPNIIEAPSLPLNTPTVSREAWTIRTLVNEVTVFFTVRKGRKYVDDLTAAEVKVLDNHQLVEKISSFGRQSDLPLRLGLLVDTSDSVQQRFRFEKDASSRFLQKIVRPNMDLAFVMGFAKQPTLTADYTDDSSRLAAGVSELHSDGRTALFDAVIQACEKFGDVEAALPAARMLVLLSDGEDNSSRSTLDEAIQVAQRHQVTIYSISTNNSQTVQPGDPIMKRLADETGGEMFKPDTSRDMVRAFSSIDLEMRSRYTISYRPSDLVEDGRFRDIDIIAEREHKKFKVEARKGYYAPLARSAN